MVLPVTWRHLTITNERGCRQRSIFTAFIHAIAVPQELVAVALAAVRRVPHDGQRRRRARRSQPMAPVTPRRFVNPIGRPPAPVEGSALWFPSMQCDSPARRPAARSGRLCSTWGSPIVCGLCARGAPPLRSEGCGASRADEPAQSPCVAVGGQGAGRGRRWRARHARRRCRLASHGGVAAYRKDGDVAGVLLRARRLRPSAACWPKAAPTPATSAADSSDVAPTCDPEGDGPTRRGSDPCDEAASGCHDRTQFDQ